MNHSNVAMHETLTVLSEEELTQVSGGSILGDNSPVGNAVGNLLTGLNGVVDKLSGGTGILNTVTSLVDGVNLALTGKLP